MSAIPLNTVLGAMNFGEVSMLKNITKIDPQPFLDKLKSYGFNQIDTARAYGTSEEVLGSLGAQSQGFVLDTKFRSFAPQAHTPESLKESAKLSLSNLKVDKVNIMYLHFPDNTTPIEDTLRGVDEIYKTGAFEKFGLSNYPPEAVENIVKICKEKNYVLPSVYQGMYNAFARTVENKLLGILKREKISFYAYSPVAGGFFNQQQNQEQPKGGRFDADQGLGKVFSGLFCKPSFYKALEDVKAIGAKHNIGNIELAIRWIYFHSRLSKENGDAVILGVSKLEQLESNIQAAKKGPLPKEVVDVLNQAWIDIEPDSPKF